MKVRKKIKIRNLYNKCLKPHLTFEIILERDKSKLHIQVSHEVRFSPQVTIKLHETDKIVRQTNPKNKKDLY